MIVCSPDALSKIFASGPTEFRAGRANRIFAPIMGDQTLFVRDGADHLAARRLLLPALHGAGLARIEDRMRAMAEEAVSRMPRGRLVKLSPALDDIALDVLVRCVFGVDSADEARRLRPLLANTGRVLRPLNLLRMARQGSSGWLGLDEHTRWILPARNAFYDLVAARRNEGSEAAGDAVDLLVAATDGRGRPLQDDEVVDHLMTLLVAGHETTGTGLAWIISRLARDPERCARATAEAHEGTHVFIDACISETLRLHPPLPYVARRVMQDMELGGARVCEGSLVLGSVWLAHRRTKTWGPDAKTFRPERFLEGSPPGASTYLPFGGGVRRCLGAAFVSVQLRVVLAALLRQARPVAWGPIDPAIRHTITLVPASGTRVVLRARS